MGNRLRLLRKRVGLTQAALGEIMGVTAAAVSAWEEGRNVIDPIALGAAIEVLNATTDFVIVGQIRGLPFDVAVDMQKALAAGVSEGRKRGRPRTTKSLPTVQEVPDAHTPSRPRGATLHDPPTRFIPAPKTRDV